MRYKNKKRSGSFLLEFVLSVAILGILTAALFATQRAVARVNHDQLIRQRCLAAAQAELESIAATGQSLAGADVERLWPDVKLLIQRLPGRGDWKGLTRLNVVATGAGRAGEVRVELCRYTASEGEDR